MKKPSDGYIWVQRWRDNHFLDCEAVAYAAACMLGVHRISDSAQRRRQEAKTPRAGHAGRESDNERRRHGAAEHGAVSDAQHLRFICSRNFDRSQGQMEKLCSPLKLVSEKRAPRCKGSGSSECRSSLLRFWEL